MDTINNIDTYGVKPDMRIICRDDRSAKRRAARISRKDGSRQDCNRTVNDFEFTITTTGGRTAPIKTKLGIADECLVTE